ncbi:MAG TPA: PilZ domain-containing protein [Candidatus Acidoferrales bacterium]|nr:PilZ domain-containing protein [Candidatus Acidoferrales bacterium]
MNSSGGSDQTQERRSERRIAVQLPMELRGTDRAGTPFEERTQSHNVCRSGAAFATVHELDLGADVEIIIPLPKQGRERGTHFTTRGRVVHVESGKGPRKRIVGVEFTGPRFHRVFEPES